MEARANEIYNQTEHLIEKLVSLHRTLIDVLCEEYSHMGTLDVKGMVEAAHAKEVLLGEIFNHEQLRIKAVNDLAPLIGIQEPNTATMLDIANALPQQEAEKFRNARVVLNMLVQEAKNLNTRNMGFAESSLIRIEEMKRNVLGATNNTTKENYSNSGVQQPIAEQGGRLLSTEA